MNILKELFYAIWQQNFKELSDPKFVWTIYFLIFIIIYLENSFLLTAFLPGDSLLILSGMLIYKKVLNFFLSIVILTIASGLGSWMSFLQGRWLENNKVKNMLPINFSNYYFVKAYKIFNKHGFFSIFFCRFIGFIRTILPIIAGFSGLRNSRFHFCNWISAFLWVLILVFFGFMIGKTDFLQNYEKKKILILTLFPIIILIFGILSFIIFFRKN